MGGLGPEWCWLAGPELNLQGQPALQVLKDALSGQNQYGAGYVGLDPEPPWALRSSTPWPDKKTPAPARACRRRVFVTCHRPVFGPRLRRAQPGLGIATGIQSSHVLGCGGLTWPWPTHSAQKSLQGLGDGRPDTGLQGWGVWVLTQTGPGAAWGPSAQKAL